MTGHAREAIDDRGGPGGLERVADDLDRPGFDSLILIINEQICLQTIGQIEDNFAARMAERLAWEGVALKFRAQGEAEDVARAVVGLEVVTLPVGAEGARVAIDQAVLARDAAGGEAGAGEAVAEEVAAGIHMQ